MNRIASWTKATTVIRLTRPFNPSVTSWPWSSSTRSMTSTVSHSPRLYFVSYARRVKCAKESAGKRHGSSVKKIGNVHLKWTFSQASVLFLRGNPAAQRYVDRLTSKHGKAKALSILAHKLGRAVYYLLKREQAFDITNSSVLKAGRGRLNLRPNWSRNGNRAAP